jgi:hypothetical protein
MPNRGNAVMPYKSRAQQAKFHILEKQGKISHATVDEFDQASKGLDLPKRVRPRESNGTYVHSGRTTRTGSQRRARRGY